MCAYPVHQHQCTNTNIKVAYIEAVHARRGLGHGNGRRNAPPRANATAALLQANATVTGAHPQGVPASHPAHRGMIRSGVSLVAFRQAAGDIAAAGGSTAAAGSVNGGSSMAGGSGAAAAGGVAGSGGSDNMRPGYIGLPPGYTGLQPGQLSDALDTSLPLGGVCETQSWWKLGAFIFALISARRCK